ncbi:MAG: hypothetical protein R3335_02490 [Anaerolineales bacterium]|nr:hypothetical protein [Anaerolineales bacterium]
MESAEFPKYLRAAQLLLYINAGIWLIFGAATIVRLFSGDVTQIFSGIILGTLMLGNVALLYGAGLGLKRAQQRYLYFALAILALNLFLSITDEFGLFDLATVILNLATIILILASRKYFAPNDQAAT